MSVTVSAASLILFIREQASSRRAWRVLFAATAADDEAWMDDQASQAAAEVIRPGPDGVELIRAPFVRLPILLARRLVRRTIEAVGGTPTLSEVERVRQLAARGRTGHRLTLHRVDVEVERGVMRIRARG